MAALEEITTPHVHEEVCKLLAAIPRGSLLDLGAGTGAFASRAQKLGFKVTACDVASEQFKAPISFVKSDLNKRLPFKSNSYDCVTAIELIEHLENPHHLFGEVKRILRQRGVFILTTPNITHYWSKLQFLLLNQFYQFNWQNPERIRQNHNHINPLSLKEIKYLAFVNNLQIDKITYNRGTLAFPYIKIPIMPKINFFGETLIVKTINNF